MSEVAEPAICHDLYRAGHVDGVHCAGSVHCHWRGETVEAWLAHRDEAARAAAREFDRRAVEAVSGPLGDLGRAWPGPELGAVSGDAIAGAKAARMFGTPEFDIWQQVRATAAR